MTPIKLNSKSKCGSPNCACHRKTKLIGPTTWITSAIAVLIVGIGLNSQPKAFDVSPRPNLAAHRVSKPVPSDLLARTDLMLSASQLNSLQILNRSWKTDRDALLRKMEQYQPKQGRFDQVQSGLEDYSQLSRLYDLTRDSYWIAARKVLTANQTQKVDGGKP